MTLRERYEEVKNLPRPSVAMVRELCEVTKKTEAAVRRWINGEVLPDALTQEVLARHFKTSPSELFPNK